MDLNYYLDMNYIEFLNFCKNGEIIEINKEFTYKGINYEWAEFPYNDLIYIKNTEMKQYGYNENHSGLVDKESCQQINTSIRGLLEHFCKCIDNHLEVQGYIDNDLAIEKA